MTKKQDFILPVSNTLALPFPILFLKGQIDEDKDRVENPKKTLTDPAMQLVKLVMSLVCFKI